MDVDTADDVDMVYYTFYGVSVGHADMSVLVGVLETFWLHSLPIFQHFILVSPINRVLVSCTLSPK